MKHSQFILLAMVISCAFLAIFYYKINIATQASKLNTDYTTYTSSAVFDAATDAAYKESYYNYNTVNCFFSNELARKSTIDSIFESYAKSFNIQIDADEKLNNYLPVICMVDYDGYYINYTDIIKKTDGSYLERITTPINLWAYESPEYDRYTIRFYLGDRIQVIDKKTGLVYEGKNSDIYAEIMKYEDDNLGTSESITEKNMTNTAILFLSNNTKFDEIKNEYMISSIESALNYYFNIYNHNIEDNTIQYNIALSYAYGEDWSRCIDSPTIFAFMQGIQNDDQFGKYNIFSISASEIKKSTSYFVREDVVHPTLGSDYTMKYYHKVGGPCDNGTVTTYYSNEKNAALTGAYPCPYCCE